MGAYTEDFKSLIVTDYILPKKYKSSNTGFERSVEGIECLFEVLFNELGLYYVGEWHSHPNESAVYSETDLKAMINSVSCATVQVTNPILLILSINRNEIIDNKFYYYEDCRLSPYE